MSDMTLCQNKKRTRLYVIIQKKMTNLLCVTSFLAFILIVTITVIPADTNQCIDTARKIAK